jgi:F-type H+-transporting ATPase subunit alpha
VRALRQFVKSKYAELWNRIENNKDLPEADEKALAAAIEDFKKTGTF